MNSEKPDWEHDHLATARSAGRHPVLLALLSGAILGLSPAGWGLPVMARVAIGGGATLLQFLIWMPWGPGGRWARNLPPPRSSDEPQEDLPPW